MPPRKTKPQWGVKKGVSGFFAGRGANDNVDFCKDVIALRNFYF
jgi:hypothetical protein